MCLSSPPFPGSRIPSEPMMRRCSIIVNKENEYSLYGASKQRIRVLERGWAEDGNRLAGGRTG